MKFPVPSAKSITGGTILGGSIVGPSAVAGVRGDEIQALEIKNEELMGGIIDLKKSLESQKEDLGNKNREIEELKRENEIYEKYVKKTKAKLEKYRSELKDKEELIEDLNFELHEAMRDNMKATSYASYLKGVLNHFTKDDPIGSKLE